MKEFVKKNYIYLIIFVYSFFFAILSKMNMDLMWNYGFSANIADNLIPYKDFYMVITPFYPALIGNIMKIIGTNFIAFYLLNSVLITFLMWVIGKLNKNIIVPMFLAIMFVCEPNYNLMCLTFLFLIYYLETKNKNDYLIGFLLGLCFLTKSSIGLMMTIPTIIYYFKDLKKILKRIVGFIIPNVFFIIYLLINGTFLKFIDLCFLGLFDFAKLTSSNSIFLPLTILIVLIFIYRYIKTKELICLYIIFFQINNYPLFNTLHFFTAMVIVLFYLLNIFFKKNNRLLTIVSICLFLVPISFMSVYLSTKNLNFNDNVFKYRYIEDKYNDRIIALNNYFQGDFDNVYFMTIESYLYKYYFDLSINQYDLLVLGNMGYNGEEKIIESIKNLPKNSVFVIDAYYVKGIRSKKIYDYISSNYSFVATFDAFKVYKKF